MRSFVVFLLCGAASAHAEPPTNEPPIYEAELRLGYGIAVGGGGGMTSTRPTPLTIAGTGSVAINDQPHLAAYGGATLETLDRNAVGAITGIRLAPNRTLRLAAGAEYIFAPYTLWGATGSVGACHGFGRLAMCADLQLTAYFAGTDLADGRTVTHVQGVLGMVFDAL